MSLVAAAWFDLLGLPGAPSINDPLTSVSQVSRRGVSRPVSLAGVSGGVSGSRCHWRGVSGGVSGSRCHCRGVSAGVSGSMVSRCHVRSVKQTYPGKA